MELSLRHLDQVVPLERGEAGLLARATAVLVLDVTRPTTPVSPIELLACLPLARLARKLYQLHQREQATPAPARRRGRAVRPKPRQLRVSCDQLVAVLHHRTALLYCGLSAEENLLLQVVLGKFQQQALNLAHLIRF